MGIFCCRQHLKELYANLSQKAPIFALSIPKFNSKSWILPFHFENLSPLLVSPTPNCVFRFLPFLKCSKFGSHLPKGGGGTHNATSPIMVT